MGRLQRKKPANKKKKKKPSSGKTVDTQSTNGAPANKAVSLTDLARTKKKQATPFKKSATAARPPKIKEGHIENVLQFLREVKIELKKVTWPTRSQAIGSTAVVIVLVIIISLFLGLVDGGLSNLVQIVLR